VRNVRPLCANSLHRARQLERKSALWLSPAAKHVVDGGVGRTEYGDDSSACIDELAESRGPVSKRSHSNEGSSIFPRRREAVEV